jgi:hypothetical protein
MTTIGIGGCEQLGVKLAVAGFERLTQASDAKPLLGIDQIRELWRKLTIHQHELAYTLDGLRFQRIFRPPERGGIGRRS